MRNESYEKWKMEVARGIPKHLYYWIKETCFDLKGCQREGCELHSKPRKWTAVQAWNMPLERQMKVHNCTGKISLEADGREKVEEKQA